MNKTLVTWVHWKCIVAIGWSSLLLGITCVMATLLLHSTRGSRRSKYTEGVARRNATWRLRQSCVRVGPTLFITKVTMMYAAFTQYFTWPFDKLFNAFDKSFDAFDKPFDAFDKPFDTFDRSFHAMQSRIVAFANRIVIYCRLKVQSSYASASPVCLVLVRVCSASWWLQWNSA